MALHIIYTYIYIYILLYIYIAVYIYIYIAVFIPSDWKRYRDDTWDIEENVEGEQLEEFTRYLNSEVLRDKIKFTVESSGSIYIYILVFIVVASVGRVLNIYDRA